MPDLSQEASSQYWSEYRDKLIYRVLTFMEGVEDWTLDGDPDLENAITAFSKELDDLEKVDMDSLGNEPIFIRLACNIKSGRALRLLQALDTVHPGAASRLLIYAEENSEGAQDPASIFLRRNIVFERLRLLARVFSVDRFNLVTRALDEED